ncbi:YsnF/AvaK domain-containing protein [Luteipulveratus mongoliensis]|uniref:YsnF/AvaK domain-containing protein n=1 Tax=Luteipulveratus mongoliensis TaxID=571913 RepID=UPI0006971651|nr:YsnF/AvaK domain-containing protein [Luteipulveratus mongoliensis]
MTQQDVNLTDQTATRAAVPLGADAVDSAGQTVTRHEERLDVQTAKVASSRVRIGKRVVTETVQVPVQVRREILVYEELPAEDGAPVESSAPAEGAVDAGEPTSRRARRSALGADESAGPTEVVLHEERPVVSLQTVQVERVRLTTTTTDAQHTVTEPVRREQVELVHQTPTAS